MTGHDFIAYFNTLYPETTALEWDHVGLQVGRLDTTITGILVTLDVTLEVVIEAKKKGANFIVAHHPVLFHPLDTLDVTTARGAIIAELLKNGTTVYAAHTNYDVGNPGMNGTMADLLGLKAAQPLITEGADAGLGRIGHLPEIPVEAFIETVKTAFKIPYVIAVGPWPKTLTKVALSSGSGGRDMAQAKAQGADLFLTGDITHHQALDLMALGLPACDILHASEQVMKDALIHELKDLSVPITAADEIIPLRLA